MPRYNTRVQELIQKAKRTRIISNFEYLEKLKKLPPIKPIHTSTFPSISKAIDGFVPGELITVTGNTGHGKSLFCHTLTNDFCHKQLSPLWLSYEMPPRMFLNKFSLLLQFYLPEDLEPYSIDWIKEIVKKAKNENGVDIVFIDHLHYVYDMSRVVSASLDIGFIVRSLKRLAVEEEIIVFLVCHTNKAKIDSADEVGLDRIRDSSFVAQESDSVLFAFREEVSNGICIMKKSLVKICKARRTGIMNDIVNTVKKGEFLAELSQEW